jgi:aspartate/tyrosine/aromatic aminotransferase
VKVDVFLRQSFAKNAGLYGERVGALHVISKDSETADRVRSQLSVLQRSEISNPPSHGARLVGWESNAATPQMLMGNACVDHVDPV